MSKLYAIARLPAAASQAQGVDLAAVRRILAHHAARFYEGGGAVSMDDWRDLDDVERAAMIQAGRRLTLTNLRRQVQIAKGQLPEVVAELDPYEGAELAMARAVGKAAAS